MMAPHRSQPWLNKIIMILMLATTVASLRYCAQGKARTRDVLIVGTSADFPPFSFIDCTGALIGFDKDLIDEIFKRLGISYRLENMPFETLLTQIQCGSIDIIAAGMSPTPEREKQVLFTTPYVESDPLVIVTLNNRTDIASLADLNGKDVAVNQGYVADLQLSHRQQIKLLKLPSISDALLALKHAKVDAFVTGKATLKPLQQVVGSDLMRTIPIEELHESTALAVSRTLSHVKDKIDNVLAELRDDGTLAALKEKWGIT